MMCVLWVGIPTMRLYIRLDLGKFYLFIIITKRKKNSIFIPVFLFFFPDNFFFLLLHNNEIPAKGENNK